MTGTEHVNEQSVIGNELHVTEPDIEQQCNNNS